MRSEVRRREALARARALLERVLRGGTGGELAAEYPLVFDERFAGRIVALEEGGDVRSACATLVRNLVVPGARVRAGFIGSVATDPDWRGRGLATRVLTAAERALARDGCTLAVLWADDPQFYLERGWRPFGAERDFFLAAELAPRLPELPNVRRAAPDDSHAIHRLYTTHAHRVERTAEETCALLACPGMETLVATRERDLCAYACLGRGADFAHTVHEWAGAPDDVLALAREHLRRQAAHGDSAGLYLVTPPTAVALHERLRTLACPETEGILGLAKLLDLEGAAELFSRFAAPAVRATLESTPATSPRLTLQGPGGEQALGPEDALQALFPPLGDRTLLAALEQSLAQPLGNLPLAPFIWGLDSI